MPQRIFQLCPYASPPKAKEQVNMKPYLWVVIGLSATLLGVGAACGPQETYCGNEHMTCADVKLALEKKKADEEANRSDAGATTRDAIILGGD